MAKHPLQNISRDSKAAVGCSQNAADILYLSHNKGFVNVHYVVRMAECRSGTLLRMAECR